MDDHLPLCDSFNCNLRCLNFSSQYPYIIQQTDNKNTQTYQPEERVDNSDHGSGKSLPVAQLFICDYVSPIFL